MQKTAENITSKYENDKEGRLTKLIDGENYFIKCEYDGLGNVKSQVHGYGVFGSGKKYYGFNAEQYNPVTGNQNLRARQVNIRRQRFLTEDTYLGTFTETLSLNRYIYGNDNPLKYRDPSGYWSEGYINKLKNQRDGIGVDDFRVYWEENTSIIGEIIEVGTDALSGISSAVSSVIDFFNPSEKTKSYKDYNFEASENDYIVLPNYTEAINNLLLQEEMRYSYVRDDSYIYQDIGIMTGTSYGIMGIVVGNMIGGGISRIERYKDFFENEKTFARLDIKQNTEEFPRWDDAFNGQIPYLGSEGKFIYDDMAIGAADLGNILYGYWGKVLGFSDKELFYGGGFANSGFSLNWFFGKNYGDRPEDIASIMKGIELFNRVNLYGYGCK